MAYNQGYAGYQQQPPYGQQQQQPAYGQQQQQYGHHQQQQQQQPYGHQQQTGLYSAYQSPAPQHQQAPYGSPAASYQSPATQFQQPFQPPAPPAAQSAEASLRQWFDAVDVDRSGQLSTEELQRALINGDWSPFNFETVRMMMNMFDTDNSGMINFAEFQGLWKYIEEWRACFRAFDQDQSGSIDFNELKTAMRSFRYNLSDNFLRLIIKKYDRTGKDSVSFDNFVQIAVTVKSLTDAFMRVDREGKGYATIGYEQFLELVVNNR